MPRCSAAFRAGGAGSTTLPMASLYGTASSGRLVVREVGVFNTTTTAVVVALKRASTAGTSTDYTGEVCDSDSSHTVLGDVRDVHSAGPTLGSAHRIASLGAAIGSGVIWTFGEGGLTIDEGTANGLCIVCATGTSQVCDVSIVWDE